MFYESESNDSPAGNGLPVEQVSSRESCSSCGICGNTFVMASSPFRPFCSKRCQQVDLGRWFGEAYGLPWEDSSVPEESSGMIDEESP